MLKVSLYLFKNELKASKDFNERPEYRDIVASSRCGLPLKVAMADDLGFDNAQEYAADALATAIMAFRDSAQQSTIIRAFASLFDRILLMVPASSELRSQGAAGIKTVDGGSAASQ